MKFSLLSALALMAPIVTSVPAQAGTPDYMNDDFQSQRILDWGTRPIFSPDGKKLVFTEADERNSFAYEIDLETRDLRCVTCFLGINGRVSLIYYLSDGNYLISAPEKFGVGSSPASVGKDAKGDVHLFWMRSNSTEAPKALDASPVGDVATAPVPGQLGKAFVSWGEVHKDRMVLFLATLDLQSGDLSDRKIIYDSTKNQGAGAPTIAEAYSIVDGGKAVVFFSAVNTGTALDTEMFRVDVVTGHVVNISRDPHQNEFHILPDERFGLEDSNRASDPSGSMRGGSGNPAQMILEWTPAIGFKAPSPRELYNYAPYGQLKGVYRPFDVYIFPLNGKDKPRRLTHFSEHGVNAHQSSSSRDGRRIAYSVDSRSNDEFATVQGLYLGEFKPKTR